MPYALWVPSMGSARIHTSVMGPPTPKVIYFPRAEYAYVPVWIGGCVAVIADRYNTVAPGSGPTSVFKHEAFSVAHTVTALTCVQPPTLIHSRGVARPALFHPPAVHRRRGQLLGGVEARESEARLVRRRYLIQRGGALDGALGLRECE